MGLFDSIRRKESVQQKVDEYFKVFNAYTPSFTSFEGGVYEMELTRAAIHAFANHCSKLKPEVKGSGNGVLERKLQYQPNSLMDTKKYLYRLATAYSVDNTVFIAPLYDKSLNVNGFYPLLSEKCKIVENKGVKYLRYDFGDGNYGAIEFERAGRMVQFQHKSELFGSSNAPLRPTMELYTMQNQGIIEGAKNSAALRFIAKLATSLKSSDLEEERKRFNESNFSSSNNGGVLLVDQKYAEVKQINSQPYTVNEVQMNQIKENVFDYFGCSEKILQNRYSSDEWNAYYEGKIEPFALEASLVHTNMTFTEHEVAFGNEIIFTANRLQYLSNGEKLSTVTSLFDRGMLTQNEARDIFNMSHIEDGDKFYIRKEYQEYNGMEGEENASDEKQTVSSDDAGSQEDGAGTEEL